MKRLLGPGWVAVYLFILLMVGVAMCCTPASRKRDATRAVHEAAEVDYPNCPPKRIVSTLLTKEEDKYYFRVNACGNILRYQCTHPGGCADIVTGCIKLK